MKEEVISQQVGFIRDIKGDIKDIIEILIIKYLFISYAQFQLIAFTITFNSCSIIVNSFNY